MFFSILSKLSQLLSGYSTAWHVAKCNWRDTYDRFLQLTLLHFQVSFIRIARINCYIA